MEKKFTRAMVCSEFKSACRKCPLHSVNNPKTLPCWLIDESDIQTIMDDYPYTDVKARMIFNDIETRLAAVEKKVEKKDEPKFEMGPIKMMGCSLFPPDMEFVEKKKYDELEAKHEADCRLISEYDLEIKRLRKTNDNQIKELEEERDKYKELFHSLNHKHQKVVGEMKYWKERAIEAEKNACGNHDKLEKKYNKLLKDYNLLSESNNNHAKDNVELEGELEAKTNRIAALEEKLRNQRTNLASLQEKYEDACKMNKARADVYESNLKLKKTIEAKDREIDLLRSELDKYKTDDECDDSWID